MLSLQKIKDVLFSTAELQEMFVAWARERSIAGENFDEILHDLLHHGDDNNIQHLLAPFMRERVYQYLENEEADLAIQIKNDYIEANGAYIYENVTGGIQEAFENLDAQTNTRLLNESAAEFIAFKQQFLMDHGLECWNNLLQQAHETEPSTELEQFKADFAEKCAELNTEADQEIDSRQLWHKIYHAAPATQEFYAIRQQYIAAWGEIEWNNHYSEEISNPSLFQPFINILGLPEPMSAKESLDKKKADFDRKHGAGTWRQISSESPVSDVFLNMAQTLKQRYIQKKEEALWSRIYHPPMHIAAYDSMKTTFIAAFDSVKWNAFVNASDEELAAMPDSRELEDFIARKKQFTDKCRIIPNAWDMAKAYEPLPEAAIDKLKAFQTEFTQKWGYITWKEFLKTQRRDREYAKVIHLTVLAQLFGFRLDVTTINEGVELTTQHITEVGEHYIHLYCEDFSHFYIHQGEWNGTSPNGNCAYNGVAQWLQCLVLGTQPRRVMLLAEVDVQHRSSYSLVQTALLGPDEDFSLEIEPQILELLSQEEITVARIHKELSLVYSFASAQLFSEFLLAKIRDLNQITKTNKLPYNRIPLLEKITRLVKQFAQQDNRAGLERLQNTLTLLSKTLLIPHKRGVDLNWTDTNFKQNIETLKNDQTLELSEHCYGDLATAIKSTDFFDKKSTPSASDVFSSMPDTLPFQPAQRASYSRLAYTGMFKESPLEEQENWISASFCILGIFLLITGLACFIGLVLTGALAGSGPLGLYLMQLGLNTIATQLAGIIGLSAPNVAIITAYTGATMTAGIGFCLFKDFAPPDMLSHSPLLSMAK